MADVEHLKMIQGVIDRMGRNSFLLKGWSVSTSAALIGLAAADVDRAFALIAAGVALIMGTLDAYYLAVERRYRALFDTARQTSTSDYNLTADAVTFANWFGAFFTATVLPLHGVVIAAALLIWLAD